MPESAKIRFRICINCSWVTKLTKYVYGFEYAWISHVFWMCLNINEYVSLFKDSEHAWICQNIPEYGQICLNMSNVVNMAECLRYYMRDLCNRHKLVHILCHSFYRNMSLTLTCSSDNLFQNFYVTQILNPELCSPW